MKSKFQNKRILFIAPKFFGYEREIQKKLTEMGALVDYYDERPSNDFITKSLIRLNKNLIANKNNEYYEKIIDETKSLKYDVVLIVRGEAISRKKLIKLKEKHENTKFILYLWDALSYNPNTNKIKDLFDKIYTFDYNDSLKHEEMSFRPLFYSDSYKNIGLEFNKNTKYDLTFIGTVHTDRYDVLKKIKTQLDENEVNSFFYLYYPSKILFWIKKIFDKNFRSAKYSDFKFKGLSMEEITSIYKSSRTVLDIERPKQNGLTIRTIEVTGSKKKLITTNESISNYNLYNKNNCLIIDRNNPKIDISFLENEYMDLNEEIYQYYYIEEWLNEILK